MRKKEDPSALGPLGRALPQASPWDRSCRRPPPKLHRLRRDGCELPQVRPLAGPRCLRNGNSLQPHWRRHARKFPWPSFARSLFLQTRARPLPTTAFACSGDPPPPSVASNVPEKSHVVSSEVFQIRQTSRVV